MNYGLYLSASGVLTNAYRQDVYANNLANVNTVAFKPDLPTLTPRPAEAVEDLTPLGTSSQLLDRLGGGVLAGPQTTRHAVAPVQQTGRDLDLALTEPDQFLAVQDIDPATGNTQVKLTRDGRLAVSGDGFLVTATGHRVLDAADQPIALAPDTAVTLTPTGQVQQDGNTLAQLQVAAVDNPQALTKTGANLFQFAGNDPRTRVEAPQLRVGALEASGTDAIKTMMNIMASGKAAQANAKLIQYHDTMMDHAVNTLGRVG